MERADFSAANCSPLINGGCGVGKTTTLCGPEAHAIFARKLGHEPRILFVESRALVRDQLRARKLHPSYDFKHLANLRDIGALNSSYDIIILDEAHSLFGDSSFAADTTAPFCEWLRDECTLFQIYITASDVEFVTFAANFFNNHEFDLTFPDLNELHLHYSARQLILSPSGETVDSVIEARHFVQAGKRGLFFIMGAVAAYRLYLRYSELGFKCAFYISQSNASRYEKHESNELEDLCETTYTVSIKDAYDSMERRREAAGLPTVRAALVTGQLPDDIDFLFITDVGQEGVSIEAANKLDFVFIEDFYPMRINQKIFRYRDNVSLAYVLLPLKRLYQAFKHAAQVLEEMSSWSQDKLEGYYLGSKGTNNVYRKAIWYDKAAKTYKLAENYRAYVAASHEQMRQIQNIMLLPDGDAKNAQLGEIYGKYADNFAVEDTKDYVACEKMREFMKKYPDGYELEEADVAAIIEAAKQAGIRKKRETNYGFTFVQHWLEKKSISFFEKSRKSHKKKSSYIVKIPP